METELDIVKEFVHSLERELFLDKASYAGISRLHDLSSIPCVHLVAVVLLWVMGRSDHDPSQAFVPHHCERNQRRSHNPIEQFHLDMVLSEHCRRYMREAL